MNTKEVLIAARALIADREHWTQREHARRSDGEPCSALSPKAFAFCFDGALGRAAGGFSLLYQEASNALCTASIELYGTDHITLNDHGAQPASDSYKAGLKCFDLAIAKLA
jgi:hypothetical protein